METNVCEGLQCPSWGLPRPSFPALLRCPSSKVKSAFVIRPGFYSLCLEIFMKIEQIEYLLTNVGLYYCLDILPFWNIYVDKTLYCLNITQPALGRSSECLESLCDKSLKLSLLLILVFSVTSPTEPPRILTDEDFIFHFSKPGEWFSPPPPFENRTSTCHPPEIKW